MPFTPEQIAEMFTYHAPKEGQPAHYEAIRAKARELAETIIAHTPTSPDQTVAIRKLRECVHVANAAIALEGEVLMAEQRTVTAAAAAAQREGSTRVAPGLWIDRTGAPHFSVPELLAHFGWPNTPENRAAMTTWIETWLSEHFPETAVIQQDMES